MNKATAPALLVGLAVLAGCASETPRAASAPSPGDACIEAIVRNPDFTPIRDKVFLGGGQNQPASMMEAAAKPTDAEKRLIISWLEARQECYRQDIDWFGRQGYAKEYTEVRNQIETAFEARTRELIAGYLSYGQYARARRDLAERLKVEYERTTRYLQAR